MQLLSACQTQLVGLLASTLLQGDALKAAIQLVERLAGHDAAARTLMTALEASGREADVGGAAVHHLAASFAAVVSVASGLVAQSIVNDLQIALRESTDNKAERSFIVHCIGAVGQRVDLLAQNESLVELCVAGFDSAEDEFKSACAAALGGLLTGCPEQGLAQWSAVYEPLAADDGASTAQQYLLLSALRTFISNHRHAAALGSGNVDIGPYVGPLWARLMQAAGAADEGIRSTVADCMGRLAVAAPAQMGSLLDDAGNDAPSRRWTHVTAIRLTLRSAECRAVLADRIQTLLELMRDPDLAVRQAMTSLIQAVITHHVQIVEPYILPSPVRASPPDPSVDAEPPSGDIGAGPDHIGVVHLLLYEMSPRQALKRTVDLGPFKHIVDEGLPLRKAAYSAMTTLVRVRPGLVPPDVVQWLVAGVSDDDDVSLLAQQLILLLTKQPAWRSVLLSVAADLEPRVRTILGSTKVDPAVQRTVVRVSCALYQLEGGSGVPALESLIKALVALPAGSVASETLATLRAEGVQIDEAMTAGGGGGARA